MKCLFIVLLLVIGVVNLHTARAEITFTPGHIYSANFFSRTIIQYNTAGEIAGSVEVPSALAEEIRGLAFGPDDFLYATAVREVGFAVIVFDQDMVVQETYPMDSVYLAGNLSHGKLAVDGKHIFVAGANSLTRFDVGSPNSGKIIYSDNQIFDVKILPNGNLFVASAYDIHEVTRAGEFVRDISLVGNRFTDIRGIEYNPDTNKLFVTHIGHTNFFYRLMRVDASTGVLEDDVTFTYAGDLFLTESGRLLVGSSTNTPGIYSQDLEALGTLGGAEQMFVTQYSVTSLTEAVTTEFELERSVDLITWERVPVTSGMLSPTGSILHHHEEDQAFFRLRLRTVDPAP